MKESTTFEEIGVSELICRAIRDMGFEAPTSIQSAAIPKILEGGDVTGQAQTGTGKTAAFAIPLLQKLDTGLNQVQALVLCPTRELAVQITGEVLKLGSHIKGLKVTPVYGGQPIGRQIQHLKSGSHVVVGTPGRVIDHLKRGTLSLGDLRMAVLDEADEMLNMGFREDIETILGYASDSQDRQTVMFSATLSPVIQKMINRWFRDPELIRVESKASGASGIDQYLLEVRDSMRTEAISRLLDMNSYRLALIFCNTKRACDQLVDEMKSRGYSSGALHGDMNQKMRDQMMAEFRSGRVEILIATDVAARGLDVENVDAVFNYDIPQDPEYYVHRIGRTGRAGREGVAYTFSSGRKSRNIRFLEKQLGLDLKTIPIPSVQEVESFIRDAFLEEVTATLEAGGLRPHIEQIEAMIPDQFTPIEVAAALLKMRESARPERSAEPVEREAYSGRKQGKSGLKRGDKPKDRNSKRGDQKKGRKGGKDKGREKQEPFYTPYLKKDKQGKSFGRKRKDS